MHSQWVISLLVDDHDHATLAVRTSCAVQPDRVRVVHHDGVRRDLKGIRAGIDRQGAGVDTVSHGVADVVEVGLGDCVSASPELELNHAAGLSSDLLGPELEAGGVVDGVPADADDVDIDG